jgi:hypothetical protein
VVANCDELHRLSLDGNPIASVGLPGGACAIVSTGSVLRFAQNDMGILRWYALDPSDGTGAQLLTIDVKTDRAPAVAWDGSGFGVTWTQDGELGYAHIACE